MDRTDGKSAARPVRDHEHVAFRFDSDPEKAEHRKGHRLSDRILVAPVHLFGLLVRVERVVDHLCCADHLQFCDHILVYRSPPREFGCQGLCALPVDSRLVGAAACAVPDVGLGHDPVALKPVGHDERSHARDHSALSRRRDMARTGETDACLKSDVAEIFITLTKEEALDRYLLFQQEIPD